jgi:hypothetical protein
MKAMVGLEFFPIADISPIPPGASIVARADFGEATGGMTEAEFFKNWSTTFFVYECDGKKQPRITMDEKFFRGLFDGNGPRLRVEPHVTRKASALTSSKPPQKTLDATTVQYAKDQRIDLEKPARLGLWQFVYLANFSDTGDRLRIFIDYAQLPGGGGVGLTERKLLGEVRDFVIGKRLEITVLSQVKDATAMRIGAISEQPLTDQNLFDTSNKYRARIVLRSDDGKEQNDFVFLILPPERADGISLPRIVTPDDITPLQRWDSK